MIRFQRFNLTETETSLHLLTFQALAVFKILSFCHIKTQKRLQLFLMEEEDVGLPIRKRFIIKNSNAVRSSGRYSSGKWMCHFSNLN